MNIATAISLIAAALDLFIGAFVLGLARAPGWRHYRVFACIAFSAAIYSAANVTFSHSGVTSACIPSMGRLNLSVAGVNASAWILFVRQQCGQPLKRLDYVFLFALLSQACAALIPGLMLQDAVFEQHVAWAGVSYRVISLTLLGEFATFVNVLAYCWTALQYVLQLRHGDTRAWNYLPGFAIFLLTAVNEGLVSAGYVKGLYLSDVGLLAALLGFTVDVVLRVTDDASQLRHFTSQLSREVENRDKELTSAKQHLAHSDRLAALGRLSASIGHEINNPLTYVIGNIEYAAEEMKLLHPPDSVHESLEEAREGVERIRTIVRELRSFSRSGDEEPEAVIPLETLLSAAIRLTAAHLRQAAVLHKELQPELLVYGSSTRLTQVFVNLLTNAAQAIPASRAGTHDAQIWIRAFKLPSGRIRIEIEDTGTGIDERAREQLFEPFFTTKPLDKGTGLGLFVSLGIVSAAGGSLDIRNRAQGPGSIVTVDLPAAEKLISEPPPISAPQPVNRPLHILIVDDDPLVAKTLARLLRRHQVECVSNGAAAWSRLSRNELYFDVVICDIMMPGISGIDLHDLVQAQRPELNPRFIFMSGGAVAEDAREFITHNADRFLPKPVDNALLHRLVAERAQLPSTPAPAPRPAAASATVA